MNNKKKIINREISWLSFNHRVLQEAADQSVPLVERMRFLGIFSNNLDEFFKVRVASVRRMRDLRLKAKKLIGGNPKKILDEIQKISLNLQNQFQVVYSNILLELEQKEVYLTNEKQLNENQNLFVKQYFNDVIMPAITPIMLNNVDIFPHLRDKSIYLAIKMTSKYPKVKREYALIEVPTKTISRFLVLPPVGNKKYFIILDDVIRARLQDVFSIFKFDNFEAYTIKITRDAELDLDNDLSKSFLEIIAQSVKDRKKGQPVRFVYDKTMPKDLLNYLITKLEIETTDALIPGNRYHNFKDFINFPNIKGGTYEYKPIGPLLHPNLIPNKSILNEIKQEDFMLHYPYHSFNQYINLLREAAIDPQVVSIKITIYRIAKASKVITALINAARNGKKVTAIFELRARFDEELNIYWAQKLQEAGANILFGVKGLKVHSKLTLITRREHRKLIRFACVGTGNVHEGNAAVYVDSTLFTADPRITTEVNKVFDFLENPFRPHTYKHLIVSPVHARRKISNLIENEIRNAHLGKKASIIMKLNNLVDREMIIKLYKASKAGVNIQLIIRGVCSLIPEVPGMSEHIKVCSIVGRFLEHNRFLVFHNDGDPLYYISSADLMTRNLYHRVEVICPVFNPKLRKEINKMLRLYLIDNVKARIINEKQDNKYRKVRTGKKINSQMEIYKLLDKDHTRK